ncbi:ankyrin repeat-containing domain protein [Trichoderma compactum]
MDPVSLAVGFIGLAGLFSTCLDLAKKVDNYKHFKKDGRTLAAQFTSHRLRFEKWGKTLGLDQAALSQDQHEALVDTETLETVRKIIDIIHEILSDQKQSPPPKPAANPGRLLARSLTEPFRISLGPKKEKLSWALKGKEKRADQVELIGKLVQHLYHLVPIESITRTTTVNGIQSPNPTVQVDKSWTVEVRDTLQKLEGKAHAETRRELHAWLVRHPPNEIYEDAIQKRLEDTCEWIFKRPALKDWLSLPQSPGAPSILWINGPAGFGKTILSAWIIQCLRKSTSTPVASFFFSSDFESRDDPYEAIRLWVWEVISRNQPAFDHVYVEREKQHEPAATRTFILSLFSDIIRLVPGCIFVIDGLDECSWLNKTNNTIRGDSITSFLEKLGGAIAGSDARILITSRDEPAIRDGFESIQGTKSEYSIVSQDVGSDTRRFARSIVETKLSKKSESLKNGLSEKMAEKCGGQFLWLKLQEDSLRSWKNEKQLQDAIEKTPSGLDNLYHRNWVRLSQLPKDEKDRAFCLLRWVTFAIRPLTIAEIAEAMLISFEDEELPVDELPDFIDDGYVNSEITGVLGSLLDIRKDSMESNPGFSTLRLAHFSVKQYFLSHDAVSGDTLQANEKLRSSNERAEHITLARLCLRYIHYEHVWQFQCDQEPGQVQRSFRDYAAGFWDRHAHNGNLEDEVIKELMDSLFDTSNCVWDSWKNWFDLRERDIMEGFFNMSENAGDMQPPQSPHSPVYYASKLDLTQVTIRLSQKYPDQLNEKSFFGETALAAACQNGNEAISEALIAAGASVTSTSYNGQSLMRLLLENGAEPNAVDKRLETALHYATYEGPAETDSEGVTALHQAASHGLIDVAELLVRQNIEGLHITTDLQQTPLHIAAIKGHVELARLLLDYGADLNAVDAHLCTALLDAASFGFTEVVRFLLSLKPELDIQDGWGQTALACAAKNGHSEIIQLLLDSGSDPTIGDEFSWSALHLAAFQGGVDAVRVLLRNGADIMGTTEGGQVETVKFLFESGVDLLAAQRNQRKTPLSGAIALGKLEVTEFFFNSGVSHSTVLETGFLPLTLASHWGQIDTAKLLLSYGADIEGSTADGVTPLLAAISNNEVDMVQFLLQMGADATVSDNDGNTALRNAIYEGNAEIVKLLLDNGVDPTVGDAQGWKPLNLAAHNGHVEIINLLLERGSNISDMDVDGWTPLHSAADGGHLDTLSLFLSKGISPAALDYIGRTSLHVACLKGHNEVIEKLLNLSTPEEVNRSDAHQRTPLFYAAMRGHHHVLELLLSKTAEVHLKDFYGSTALFAAVRNAHEEVVDQLLTSSGGIPLDSKDAFGKSIFDWARKSNNVRVIEILSQFNENVKTAAKSDSVLEQSHQAFDSKAYWCDVCTRCISGDYFECSCTGEFIACQECVAMGAKCLDESHIWTATKADYSSEEEDN